MLYFFSFFLPSLLWCLEAPATNYADALPGFGGSLAPATTAAAADISTETIASPDQSRAVDFESLIIQEVRLTGQKNAKESLIRSQIKTRKGELFDAIQAKSDLKRLAALGPFSSADVSISTIEVSGKTYLSVTFRLEEKPKVKKVKIFGAKMVSKGTIKDILAPAEARDQEKEDKKTEGFPEHRAGEWRVEIDEGAYLDEAKLAESLAKIYEKYEEKSVFGTQIEVKRKLDDKLNKIELEFVIQEGRRARLALIELAGFTSYPLKKIKRIIKSREGKTLDSKKLKKGLEKLNELYKENGWLDFTFEVSTRTAAADEILKTKRKFKPSEIPVALKVEGKEGKRHYLLGYVFGGQETISETELRKLANLTTGRVLKESELAEAQMNILNAYRDRGRLFASIDLEKHWSEEPPGVSLDLAKEGKAMISLGPLLGH
ncbi:MAG: hypothetical protein HY747_05130 [Elusimicrobia bacterium]|nr:hypothetical protein [Elusimicrobiota bacterium]